MYAYLLIRGCVKMANLTKELKEMYGIVRTKEKLTIHKPAYIAIRNYTIEKDEVTFDISNDSVSISLLRKTNIMHITVFDKFKKASFISKFEEKK